MEQNITSCRSWVTFKIKNIKTSFLIYSKSFSIYFKHEVLNSFQSIRKPA